MFFDFCFVTGTVVDYIKKTTSQWYECATLILLSHRDC